MKATGRVFRRDVQRCFAVAFGLAMSVFSSGCPGGGCPTLPHTDPSALLRAHRALRRPARTMRAEARVEQWGEHGRLRGTVLMFVAQPQSVRFDAMTQFGPAAVLTSDGTEFALMDMRERRFVTGPACPENIALLLGVPLSGADVTRFLLGDTPRIEAASQTVACNGDGGYLVTLTAATGERQEIELLLREHDAQAPPLEQRTRLSRSELFDAEGDTIWRTTFEDHRVVRDPGSPGGLGVALPFRVRFEHPGRDADTTVRFVSIELNVDVPPGVFRQSPPPGLPREVVLCPRPE